MRSIKVFLDEKRADIHGSLWYVLQQHEFQGLLFIRPQLNKCQSFPLKEKKKFF